VSALFVPDEAWAERSQAALEPIRVGGLIVAPPGTTAAGAAPGKAADIVITIQPSMGFGTGHHQSTRLCLHLLQSFPIARRSVLDAGTGSGVLAIAAWRLGAARVLAIDVDPDAIAAARENVERNNAGAAVALQTLDLAKEPASIDGTFDVVTANLTGATLKRLAPVLAGLMRRGGTLVAGGFQTEEETDVAHALGTAGLLATDRAQEDDWIALRCQYF